MKFLFYDKKKISNITDEEAESIQLEIRRGSHINFKGSFLKSSKIEIINEEQEDIKIWQKSTDELKEIIGDFENQLKSHKDNIPSTREGKSKAIQDGKLPDVGMWWLEDRGVMLWYLKNGWLFTENPKEGEKRRWSVTTKYISDGVPKIEEALDELQHRRIYAEEEAIKNGDPIIAEMYEKEQREKIDALRKKLQMRFGWDNKKVETKVYGGSFGRV